MLDNRPGLWDQRGCGARQAWVSRSGAGCLRVRQPLSADQRRRRLPVPRLTRPCTTSPTSTGSSVGRTGWRRGPAGSLAVLSVSGIRRGRRRLRVGPGEGGPGVGGATASARGPAAPGADGRGARAEARAVPRSSASGARRPRGPASDAHSSGDREAAAQGVVLGATLGALAQDRAPAAAAPRRHGGFPSLDRGGGLCDLRRPGARPAGAAWRGRSSAGSASQGVARSLDGDLRERTRRPRGTGHDDTHRGSRGAPASSSRPR